MEMINRIGLPRRLSAALFVCLLLLIAAGGGALANGEEPGAMYYADIKSQFNISFYSDLHCTIGGKYATCGDVVIPSYVIVQAGDGISGIQAGDPPKTYRVTEIGGFSNNVQITSITIPEGIEKIGNSAFLNCTGLTGDLVIPDSVTSMGGQSFRGCTGLTGSLTIGRGLTAIEGSTFFQCGFTGTLTIPDTITTIENYAFQECAGFTGPLVIPASVETLGYDAFRGCTGFTGTLTLPATSTVRRGRTFYGCSGLTGLIIEDGVTGIGEQEFYGCTGMTGSLAIPDSVTTIDWGAFRNCSGLTGTLTLPSGITEINSYTFCNCAGLTGLNLPAGVITIYASAFEGCTGMTGALILPSSLQSVRGAAFMNCGFTGSLTLPEGLEAISGSAFACPNIDGTLTIPSTVGNADEYAFTGMLKVKKIINHSSEWFYLIKNSIAEGDTVSFFVRKGTTEHLTIYTKDGYKESLGQGTYLRNGEDTEAFGVADFNLPASIAAIPDEAFVNIAASIVDIPAACRSIGSYAFRDCPNLTQIRVPAECEICEGAFDGCAAVTIFGAPGSPAEGYCQTHGNCAFAEE